MQMIQRGRDLAEEMANDIEIHRAIAIEILAQGWTFEQLEHDPGLRRIVRLPQVVNARNIGMGQKRHRSRFVAESCPCCGVVHPLRLERLQRHRAPCAKIATGVDEGHAARSDRLGVLDLIVIGDDDSRSQVRRGYRFSGHWWIEIRVGQTFGQA